MNKYILLFAALVPSALMAQDDVEGSRDHALLTRFPGSFIVQYEQKNFDEAYWYTDRNPGSIITYDQVHAEGKISRITYRISKEHSTLEVHRSYERALQSGGFEIVFSCRDDKCASIRKYLDLYGERPIGNSERFYSEGRRALVANRNNDYVFLFVYLSDSRDLIARVRIIEGGEIQENQIRVDASTISKEIEESGSIALYDILFDVDKAEIKKSSAPILKEIAEYLTANKEIKIYVVGHTDNTGSYSHNLDLSKRRANAVVAKLTKDQGVDSSRLKAEGRGPVAPGASNLTEAGRAQNRRVQLVAQ